MVLMFDWWQLLRFTPPFSSLHLRKLRKPGFSPFWAWWKIQTTRAPACMWDPSLSPPPNHNKNHKSVYFPSSLKPFQTSWGDLPVPPERLIMSLRNLFFFVPSWCVCGIINICWKRKCFLRSGHGVNIVRGSGQINHNQTLHEGKFTCFSRGIEISCWWASGLGEGFLLEP